jgi:HSP20 family molecular chaperone IbpA
MAYAEKVVERKPRTRLYAPDVDIVERPEGIEVAVDMPGVDEKSIGVTLEDGVLTIEGRVKKEKDEARTLRHREYGTGDYRRTFRLSDELDAGKIKATLRDGTLMLAFPKAEKAKPRRIEVEGP